MTNPVLLDSNTHLNIRIVQGYSADLGDNVCIVPVVPREFAKIAAHYPILLTKEGNTGQFVFNALLGFEEGENLFLEQQQWLAEYIPLHIKRLPFSIGVQVQDVDGQEQHNPMINIDMDSPRVSNSEGERLFQEHGGQTQYLQNVNSMLAELINGGKQTKAFVQTLLDAELIESIKISITLDNGKNLATEGLYSINQEKLAALNADQLDSLHKSGLLELVFLLKSSLEHLPTMIARKNQRLTD